MSELAEVRPRHDFDVGKLRLEFEEEISSDINVVDEVVTKIVGLVGHTGCDQDLGGH